MFVKSDDLKTTTPEIKNRIFFARVVSNVDPLKKQRIQFRIKGLHRGIPDDKLPWAAPEKSLQHAVAFNLPPSGAVVKVFYQDEYSVFYSATIISEYNENLDKGQGVTETQAKYVDYAGNYLFTDNQTGNWIFKHFSGTQIQIDPDGNVIINSKSLSVYSDNIELDAATLNLKASNMQVDAGTLNINASTLNLNGGTTTVNSNSLNLNSAGAVIFKSSGITLGASGSVAVNASGITLGASGSVAVNAGSFALNAGFNLVPITGWATPPVPAPGSPGSAGTAPGSPTNPASPTLDPETAPIFTPFTGQINY